MLLHAFFFLCLALPTTFFLAAPVAAKADGYKVDIIAKADSLDRIRVAMVLPPLSADSNVIVFPVTIPGTYELHLWWRFVREFTAFDKDGRRLPTTRTADSQFVIPKNTHRIAYSIHDSFDDRDKRASVFHPAGTSFQGDSVFVLNHGGIVSYVYGMQKLPYTVSVHHKKGITTQTALTMIRREAELDVYKADSYDALVDGPALVCSPDTASFQIKDMHILVAVCGPKPADHMAEAYVKPLMQTCSAIGNFLPSLPVKNYAFLFYLWNGDSTNVLGARYAQGALEHGNSSFYFWRYGMEVDAIQDIAAHEFLHILVPLNLHSNEIDAFDFRWPQMSEHLWLYEGVTEYFAHQSLLRGGVSSDSVFTREMASCARSLSRIPKGFTLTTFSRNVLTDENQRLYPIIYQYGPLNALLIDILLRRETKGTMGLLELVYELMHKYGPSRPFTDSLLFTEIGRLTTPAVQKYFETYVADANRLPLANLLPLIGWEFVDSTRSLSLTFGIRFDWEHSTDSAIVIKPGSVNPLAVRKNDILVEVNGVKASTSTMEGMRRLWKTDTDEPITIVVERSGQRVTLTAPPVETVEVLRNVIREVPSPSAEQLAFRKLVLYGK